MDTEGEGELEIVEKEVRRDGRRRGKGMHRRRLLIG